MLKTERWIVYPLLMLSLFSSLVGVQVIRAQQEIMDTLTVRSLSVVGVEGQVLASIGPGPNGGGFVTIFDENGRLGMMIVADSEYRGLGVVKENGELGISIGSDGNTSTIEGYGKNSNIAFRITPSKLTYYRTMANGITEMGSELDERGLTIRAIGDNPTTRYSVDEIRNSNYTGVGSFKLPRNTTIRSF